MLNTGLALQKPHDSMYSKMRCFFMSNGGIPLKVIKDELRRKASGNVATGPGYLVSLVEQHQQAFCALHGLHYTPSQPLSLSTPVRNCPACAQVGYHSTVFQWQWLTHCPIHRLPLFDHCPTCHQRWPSVIQMMQRHCSSCGWSTRYDPTLHARSMEDDFTILCALHEVDQFTHSVTRARLIPQIAFTCTLNGHDKMPVEHPLFASSYCGLLPQKRLPLIKAGVCLQSMIVRRFSSELSPHDHEFLKNPKQLHQLEVMIRTRCAARIQRCIAQHCRKPLQIPSGINSDFEGMDKHTNCYLYAYLFWRTLVNDRYGVGNHQAHRSRYFEVNANIRYPLLPLPMDYIEVTTAESTYSSMPTTERRCIPLGLRNLVYELDLWLCFKSILKYFDALKSAQEGVNWFSFYDGLPYWAQPGESYSDGISVYWDGGPIIELLAPRAYYWMNFDDMELQD